MANIFATKTQGLSAVDYFKAKLSYEIGSYGLKGLLDEKASGYQIVDVRSPEDFDEGHIPTALNIPLEDLPGMMSSLAKNKTIVTYCGSITCQAAPKAALELAQKGFKVMQLFGGLKEWTNHGYPIEKSA